MKKRNGNDMLLRELDSLKRRLKDLEAGEKRFKATLYSIGDGMIATDAEGRVDRMNPVAEALTGWSEAEALGRPVEDVFCIVDEQTRVPAENPIARVLREGAVAGLGNHTLLVARDGIERPIADSGAPIRDEQGAISGVVLVFRDQTEERRARDREALLMRMLQAIRDVNQLILTETDPKRLIERVCEGLIETLGYYNAWIALMDEGGAVTTTAASGFDGGFVTMEERLERGTFPNCIKRALGQDALVVIGDPPAECPDCPLARKYAGRAGLSRSLAFKGHVYGILSVSVPGAYAHDAEAQKLFKELADDLGFALHKLEGAEALRQSEVFLNTLLNAIPIPVFYKDVDGRYIGFNRAFETFFGQTRERLMGKIFDDINPPEFAEFSHAKDQELFENRGTQQYDSQAINAHGERRDTIINKTVFFDREGAVSGLVGTILDITERKRAEQALRDSMEKYEKTLQTAPVWVVLSSLEEGRYLEANEAFFRTMGFRREEAVGKTSIELETWVDPRDRERVVAQVKEKGGVRNVEIRRRVRSGEIIDTLMSAEALRLGDEELMVTVTQDITERKRAEEEKARLEQQVHQAQKLESIGRLAGGVAHDLNNLLSPILGYGEMLLQDAVGGNLRREPLEEIVNAGRRARDLVRELLAFSRKQMLEFKPIHLNALLREFEKLLRRTIREDIAIRMILNESLSFIKGDVGQLEQVVMNLVVNAQDAMPDGGELTIETAQVELDESYAAKHEGVTPGVYVMLVVSDTGEGMDAETLEDLFEPFFTTKEIDKGTGLGLATVYGIVKQHGGNIWAYSEPGLGSSFKVYLPVSEEPSCAEKHASKTASDLQGSETVLLVEDNEQVRNLAFAILKRNGYTVLVAESGREALATLDHYEGTVHLLLTDVVMPDMNGKQLFERISGPYPDVKVLYMSGYPDNVIAHHGVMDAGIHFIQKPFSTKALAAKVRETLDQ